MEVTQEQFDLLCDAAVILHDCEEAHAKKVADALDELLTDAEVVKDEDDEDEDEEDDEDDEQDEDDEAD